MRVKLLSKNARDFDLLACRPQTNEENEGFENFMAAEGNDCRLWMESDSDMVGPSISFRFAVPFIMESIRFSLRTISKRYSA